MLASRPAPPSLLPPRRQAFRVALLGRARRARLAHMLRAPPAPEPLFGCSATSAPSVLTASGGQRTLARHRERAREIALGPREPGGVVEFAAGIGEAQAEDLFAQLGELFCELCVLHVPELFGLHGGASRQSSRRTNFDFTGSLCAASLIASRASGSETPASSNITRPGLTTATHPSGDPLPEPMRVSAGFFVTGLSGKTLIQTLPPRLILRVIAIRAASIWRLVSQPLSSALSPYSPNCTLTCPREIPRRRPRCCLRCLTRLGDSISAHPPPRRRPWPEA